MGRHTHRGISFRTLVTFFVVAFAVSWLAWLPQALDSVGVVDLPDAVGLLGILGPFGPFVAAAWLTRRAGGGPAVRALLRRGWSRDFDKRWLVPTVLLMPGIALATVGVMTVTGQDIEWDQGIAPVAIVPTFLLILVMNAAPEEYGWRGYALAPMMERHGALAASLILGAVWGLWHLPLHFIDGTVQAAIPIHEFVLQQMVLAVFYTWLFANTRGAVSVAIVFHAVANIVGATVPYWTTAGGRWTGFAVQVAVAIAIVAVWGPRRLSRSPSAESTAVA
ncbi:CPBP family intramembrane glutamic endopeptidase [Demequina pelophila]|uniref:CPBP family intramembrane glutamic endopeptidase n=1 Tax=Demequina pelophila TaxID=1638984 RepID=UPI0007861A73|nr:CPBP family intramembrane glutamic endopeptidase [Demequina pelophila]